MKLLRETDFGTLVGATVALVGIVFGFRLEGIHLVDIGQLTAALVVFCGTAGAVLISMPWRQTEQALKMIPGMLRNPDERDGIVINRVLEYARGARQGGLLSLEKRVEAIEDPFFRKAMRLAVDGVGSEVMGTVLDSDIAGFKLQSENAALVYETAAGYAPTMGMAGAAIELIQVMKHLEQIDQVGMGVAAAFVATIYGVLLANLVLLPIATKIRARAEYRNHICGLVREGALSIAAGLNPSVIRLKLEALAQIGEKSPVRPVAVAAKRTRSALVQ
jgi:chemotaxis protein MotA